MTNLRWSDSVVICFVASFVELLRCFFFFFFNDTATTEIYTLSLHDALPISTKLGATLSSRTASDKDGNCRADGQLHRLRADRKSTRLNSSHLVISYAVFCLKKKKKQESSQTPQSPKHLRIPISVT